MYFDVVGIVRYIPGQDKARDRHEDFRRRDRCAESSEAGLGDAVVNSPIPGGRVP